MPLEKLYHFYLTILACIIVYQSSKLVSTLKSFLGQAKLLLLVYLRYHRPAPASGVSGRCHCPWFTEAVPARPFPRLPLSLLVTSSSSLFSTESLAFFLKGLPLQFYQQPGSSELMDVLA